LEVEVTALKFKTTSDVAMPITTKTTRISMRVKPFEGLLHPVANIGIFT